MLDRFSDTGIFLSWLWLRLGKRTRLRLFYRLRPVIPAVVYSLEG